MVTKSSGWWLTEATPTTFPYQATINIDFQLSNVISANSGNGINISGSNGNVIAMNYIGTDPAGSTNPDFGNGMNGILITGASSGNLIGGQAAGINNPTGSKNPANAVFQRPPQGNLISGNLANGVLINGAFDRQFAERQLHRHGCRRHQRAGQWTGWCCHR